MVLQIREEFGYVMLSIAASWFMNAFLISVVVKGRQLYGVKYPHLYAPLDHENKEDYDCFQRAHQNTLETWPSVCILVLLNGLQFPVTAAILMNIYSVGRIMYGYGYSHGGPKGRETGAMISVLAGIVPLVILCFVSGLSLSGTITPPSWLA